ncbi:MAG: transposase, partial [Acidaminococcaceae bacterium]|nr:transposase [Acidaminococcaceae bacterium]
ISRYSNGYIEGHNNKIKVVKRLSFGIKNFNILRNRILYMA